MSLNRRQFLKGIVGLAATAVVVSAAGDLMPLSIDACTRLIAQAKSGNIIRDQWFEFFGPVTIERVDNLLLDNCHFVFHNVGVGESCLTVNKCEFLTINNCVFDHRGPGTADAMLNFA